MFKIEDISLSPKVNKVFICATCESEFPPDGKNKNRKYCSKKCYGIWRATLIKEKHPNWKGGISVYDYETMKAMKDKKKLINKCEKCGCKNQLHAHHIKSHSEYPNLRANLNNIEILCRNCHALEHPKSANALSYPRKRSGNFIKCQICEKERYVTPKQIRTAKFCSNICKIKYMHSLRVGRFTEEEVSEIINFLISKDGYNKPVLEKFNISKATLQRMQNGTYKYKV